MKQLKAPKKKKSVQHNKNANVNNNYSSTSFIAPVMKTFIAVISSCGLLGLDTYCVSSVKLCDGLYSGLSEV